jgi:hypothetical protein
LTSEFEAKGLAIATGLVYVGSSEESTMPRKPPARLKRALKAADETARWIEAALPPPKTRREKKILTAWTEEEYGRVQGMAEERGEPLAVTVRNLTLAALEAMGR